MNDPETSEQPQQERRDANPSRSRRQPFDTSDLNNIPRITDDDPPCRNWWAVDAPRR